MANGPVPIRDAADAPEPHPWTWYALWTAGIVGGAALLSGAARTQQLKKTVRKVTGQ